MKTRFLLSASLVIALLLAFSGMPVLAQGTIIYSSAYQIQNLDTVGDATVLIQYYDQATGNLTASGNVTVPKGGSKTIFPFQTDGITGPSSFNGSAVLSSDKPIAAILNTQTSSTPFYGASTNGFSGGATSASLPLIACNNGGFDTWFNVQNAGSGDANITVTYIPGSNGTAGLTDTVTGIKPGAAKTFNQKAGSGSTKNCDQLKDASGKFVGSATVASTNGQPIVASVMFLGTGGIKALQGYNGFTAGSTAINLPLVMANNSSYYTAIQVQNAGSNSTAITVTFGTNTAGSGTPNPESFTLAGGAAKTLIQLGGISGVSPNNNWNAFGKYVSGAKITQSGTEPLVAIVNQNSTAFTSLGSSYEGFDPTKASATINLPLVAANNSGFLTGIQIQAVSGTPAVTVKYSKNTQGGALQQPVDDTKTLATGETWTLIQAGGPGGLSGNNNWNAAVAGKYVGAASVTATGGTIIAIVNFNGPASLGDTFFTYDGFNQ
jgi:hypothetical protein